MCKFWMAVIISESIMPEHLSSRQAFSKTEFEQCISTIMKFQVVNYTDVEDKSRMETTENYYDDELS